MERLKEDVKHLFFEAVNLEAKLELVDWIRKLGLASHFEVEIKEALDTIASSTKNSSLNIDKNLYVTALSFTLLRQHGYEVSQEMFSEFLDEMGSFMESKCLDVKGVLELFEASHVALQGENILDEAKAFSIRILKDIKSRDDSNLSKHAAHSLDLPYHWRVQWFDVEWQINTYEKDKDTKNTLLDLAKLNFNIVQATLQKDLKEISRWWSSLGLIENLNFTRDRLVESFLCSVGVAFEPQFSCLRKWLTKAIIMVLIIDDVYDVYGSLEELQHFTDAISRRDTKEIEQLPECMQICFQALNSITGETASKKVWADFCEALLVEAKWYHKGYTPTLQEYLDNAWISSSGTVLCVTSYFSLVNDEDMQDFMGINQDLVYNISLIIRLCNDLGTSVAEQERGDAASSIVCYMREKNVSEEAAKNYVKSLINNSWKKINGQCFGLLPNCNHLNIITNMARVAHNLYQYGDGFGIQDREIKKQILSLLVDPLELD
ncbi:hypothetical protein JCGZ_21299 [Jatropha curcas]|uniref:Uncharacterized protein n=2 Tax=Jatropha curcas TaxID=180498 RepID=A0A067JDK2_JATCU|nr:hypothetical protein JCGZ_21299 [Jatropha curcas]